MEYDTSFSSDTDATFDYKFNVFPKSLNPGFDLMCVIKVSYQKNCFNHADRDNE